MFTDLSLCIIQVFQRTISHLQQSVGRKRYLSADQKEESHLQQSVGKKQYLSADQKEESHLQQSVGKKRYLIADQKEEEWKKAKQAKVCVCITQPQVSEPDHHKLCIIYSGKLSRGKLSRFSWFQNRP